jgi:hypothetical protein
MRTVAVFMAVAFVARVAHLGAQHASEPVPESLKQTLQKPQTLNLSFQPEQFWIEPKDPTRSRILTIVPPTDGEVINVSVPVGELVMRAAHAIARAQYRRQERQAHDEVQRALQEFFQAQPR